MKILLFGGTTEVRTLSHFFASKGMEVTLFVATEYGKSIVPFENNVSVYAKRLDKDEMLSYIKEKCFDYVVDTTHPYANIVTQNIKYSCTLANVEYIRLIRECSAKDQNITYVSTVNEAVELLKSTSENILLTIGSKELEPFTELEKYSERIFVRIIPMPDSLNKAIELGFSYKNIICMQGPFDFELNKAMINTINAKYIVTKDSGDTGGFSDKVNSALEVGCKVIVIARPCLEQGMTYNQILDYFNIENEG